MKRIYYLLPILLFFAACGGAPKPEKAATDFLTAVKEKKWDRAKEFVHISYQGQFEFYQFNPDSVFLKEVKDIKCTVQGDSAVCTYCCAWDGSNQLVLVQDNKKWKVKGGLLFAFEEPEKAEPEVAPVDSVALVITKENIEASNELDNLLDEHSDAIKALDNKAKKKKK